MSERKKRRITGGRSKRRTAPPYPLEFRLKVVRLRLEEGYSAALLAQEFGLSSYTVNRWARVYREQGEAGLHPQRRTPRPSRMPAHVQGQIVALRQAHPGFGARRIADWLKRFFLVRTSATSVHQTLSREGLIPPQRAKAPTNPTKPRFFERATPNQMWQSDILTFRLGGQNAYLIGFLDDYSRYLTALEIYRSQTAEQVLETYRRAVGAYGVPKEVLTDNGRQYTNWRGTTRFERELAKDRVRHIKSRPHHPMTLGKIERFWKTALEEFLQRGQFTSFADARERMAFWVQYYNHKRPHQGIGGLCPADRFFEIQQALKQTLSAGMADNALELALRGKPRDPFYMVGRLGEQSVVIRAEQGQVRLLVDGAPGSPDKELVYDPAKEVSYAHRDQTHPPTLRPAAEDHRRALDLDGAAHDPAALPGAVHQPDASQPVAEPGHGGDAAGAGPEPAGSRALGPQRPAAEADREEPGCAHRPLGEAPAGGAEGCQDQPVITAEGEHDDPSRTCGGDPCPAAGCGDHEGALRTADRRPGGGSPGPLPQVVLQVGAAGPGRAAAGAGPSDGRPPPAGAIGAGSPTGPAGTAAAAGVCPLAAAPGLEGSGAGNE